MCSCSALAAPYHHPPRCSLTSPTTPSPTVLSLAPQLRCHLHPPRARRPRRRPPPRQTPKPPSAMAQPPRLCLLCLRPDLTPDPTPAAVAAVVEVVPATALRSLHLWACQRRALGPATALHLRRPCPRWAVPSLAPQLLCHLYPARALCPRRRLPPRQTPKLWAPPAEPLHLPCTPSPRLPPPTPP